MIIGFQWVITSCRKKLKKQWFSDIGGAINGRQGWCVFILNRERFGTPESSKSQGSFWVTNFKQEKKANMEEQAGEQTNRATGKL